MTRLLRYVRTIVVLAFMALMPLENAHGTGLRPQDFHWKQNIPGAWVKVAYVEDTLYFVSFYKENGDEVYELARLCPIQYTDTLPPLFMSISWRNREETASLTGCLHPGRWIRNTPLLTHFNDLPKEARH